MGVRDARWNKKIFWLLIAMSLALKFGYGLLGSLAVSREMISEQQKYDASFIFVWVPLWIVWWMYIFSRLITAHRSSNRQG